MRGRGNPDPDHHATGKKQSPKTQFASRINFGVMQCKGSAGNLRNLSFMIGNDPLRAKLVKDDQIKLLAALSELSEIANRLNEIGAEIADLNIRKRWVE